MGHVHDVAIVGAGIAGASLAYRLAGRADVLLLEAEDQPGAHATGRSAAMFMESYGPPQARALTRASRAFFEAPPAGFADRPLLAPRGALYLAAPGQQAALDTLHAALAATTAVDRLAPAEVLARVPCLRRQAVLGALYEAAATDIDTHALLQGCLRGHRRQGGELLARARVVAARHEGSAWRLGLADGRSVRARRVVDAAGAWADEVAALFGAAPVRLQPKRRSAFTFAPPAGTDVSHWPLVAAVDEGWYFKPDAGRLLGSPANADPMPAHDVRPEDLDIALAIDRIESVSTLAIRRPQATWAGLRSFVADGELVIGDDGAVPGFFWLAGQGGYGLQSAPGASALAAALLLGEALPEALRAEGVAPEAMSPRRLPR
mgnify:CR=1 FL=1